MILPTVHQYAVIGNPVEHSLSPFIHTAFGTQTGRQIEYIRLFSELDKFNETLETFIKSGALGANVTVPFKMEAFRRCDHLNERARIAGAVNTLTFQQHDEQLFITGDNTDGIGLVRDIKDNQKQVIAQKNILILGAGGAVRGVIFPLLACKPLQVVIANRTVEKAQQLASTFATYGPITGCGFDQVPECSFDIVINGTSASLSGAVPELDSGIVQNAFCYDMAYAREPTAFLQWASQANARSTADGLGMLVEQAAEAFFIWEGVFPNTGPIINELRA